MTHIVRGVLSRELSSVREIIERAFKSDDEGRLWDYLIANDPNLTLDRIRVAEVEGRVVACTVLLPRQVRTRRGWASGAIVTLVACEPEYQGRGYGSATVKDAVAQLAEQGMAMGMLYGHPGYYPRFGFAPVLPTLLTLLPSASLRGHPLLESAGPDDLSALSALYERTAATYPCAVARSAEPWVWHSRNPKRHGVLTLPGRVGYAYVVANPDQGILAVPEAAGQDPAAVQALLRALCAEAQDRGLAKVRLSMPPGHPLVRLLGVGGHVSGRSSPTSPRTSRSMPPYQRSGWSLAHRGCPP